MSSWIELNKNDYNRVWEDFEEKFRFRPSVKPADWPGIREPRGSVTYSIAHVYDGISGDYDRLTNDLGQKLIQAFRICVKSDDSIYALEWQSTCYLFQPHEEIHFESEDDWPIPPLPNGDYYIFLTRDLESGFFGHPWEKTICIFGQNFIAAVASDPPVLFAHRIRESGKSI